MSVKERERKDMVPTSGPGQWEGCPLRMGKGMGKGGAEQVERGWYQLSSSMSWLRGVLHIATEVPNR